MITVSEEARKAIASAMEDRGEPRPRHVRILVGFG